MTTNLRNTRFVCVFDIGGNKIRLIAKVQYRTQKVFIRYVLDHPE